MIMLLLPKVGLTVLCVIDQVAPYFPTKDMGQTSTG